MSVTLERRGRVLQRRLDDGPRLSDRLRGPGEVDHERAPADAADAAGEDAERRVPARLLPDGLGVAGRVAVDRVEGGLGRHVVRGHAGASRREDEAGAAVGVTGYRLR